MKKLLILCTALCMVTNTFSAIGYNTAPKKANEIFFPVGKDKQMSLKDLSEISVKDFEKVSGKHLNFIERIGFRSGQKKLRNSINADGTVNNKRLLKYSDGDHSVGFHVGGFLLGFFLGIIGVLIAYVAGGDEDVKRNRAKWAWIGFGIYVVLLAIVIIAVATAQKTP